MSEKRYCIADERISEKCKKSLSSMGYSMILMPPFKRLASPVASHPDMLMFFSKDSLLVHKDYFYDNKDIIEMIAVISQKSIIVCEDTISDTYPNDVIFNSFIYEGYLIGNHRYLSTELLRQAANDGLDLLPLKQGYAKCSCCVTDSFIISSDKGAIKALSSHNIPNLLISEGGVDLLGYDLGFIGGASGFDHKSRKLFFCGDIPSHPDGNNINELCNRHSIEVISLSDEPLYDYGTLFFI